MKRLVTVLVQQDVKRLTCWDPYLSESIDLTDQVFPTLASE